MITENCFILRTWNFVKRCEVVLYRLNPVAWSRSTNIFLNTFVMIKCFAIIWRPFNVTNKSSIFYKENEHYSFLKKQESYEHESMFCIFYGKYCLLTWSIALNVACNLLQQFNRHILTNIVTIKISHYHRTSFFVENEALKFYIKIGAAIFGRFEFIWSWKILFFRTCKIFSLLSRITLRITTGVLKLFNGHILR